MPEDLLAAGWHGRGTSCEVSCWPSEEHEGFVNIEVADMKSWQMLATRRPVRAARVREYLASMLSDDGLPRIEDHTWEKVEPRPAPTREPEDEFKADPFVYFLAAADFIKIGTTTGNPRKRIKELQTGCPFDIELRAYVPGGVDVERGYHERFAALRVRGEWFRHEGDLAAHIAGLRGEQ